MFFFFLTTWNFRILIWVEEELLECGKCYLHDTLPAGSLGRDTQEENCSPELLHSRSFSSSSGGGYIFMKLTDYTFWVVIINLGNRIEEVFLRLPSVVLSSGRNPTKKREKKRKPMAANDDCSQSVQSVSAHGQSSSLTLLFPAQLSSGLCLFFPLSWHFYGIHQWMSEKQ